jgi:hypothetical protein
MNLALVLSNSFVAWSISAGIFLVIAAIIFAAGWLTERTQNRAILDRSADHEGEMLSDLQTIAVLLDPPTKPDNIEHARKIAAKYSRPCELL